MMETIALLFLILNQSESLVLDWLWKTEKPKDIFTPPSHLNVSFEELDPEEKFIAEAAKISGMEFGSLDVCQQKIVMRLKSSCGSLNEEQLAKLSVNLMNCELSSEGKEIYTCNEDMTLKDCTKKMDSVVWNTYHTFSNRARAVCYAARQLQFRALSEMTVNRLLGSTRSHLDTIEEFQKKQKLLQDAAEIAFRKLLMAQRDYRTSYSSFKLAENSLALVVDSNRKKVEEESQFLDQINQLMSSMTNILNQTLASTKRVALREKRQRRAEYVSLKEELIYLKFIVAAVRVHLDDTTLRLDRGEQKLKLSFMEVEKRLKAINESLVIIDDLIGNFKNIFANKLGYFIDLFGNDEILDISISILTHALALILVMILSSFLSLNNIIRWAIVTGAPFNLGLTLLFYLPLLKPLMIFYSTILLIILCDITLKLRQKKPQPVPTVVNNEFSKIDNWLEGQSGINKNGRTPFANRSTDYSRLRQYTPALSVASSVKTLCTGITKKGLDCRQPAEKGSTRCWRHNVDNSGI